LADGGWNSGSPYSIVMDTEQTAQWCSEARSVLQPVTCAKRRLSASLKVNEFAMSVAAEQLVAAACEAMAWMATNECPDVVLGTRVVWMLDTCAEAALTARRAAESSSITEPVLGGVGDLLAVIDIYAQTLEDWQ
jgi:hypothetical protein